MPFLEVLPDPEYKISHGGLEDSVSGDAGPGFASVKLSLEDNIMQDRTITGRLVQRKSFQPYWRVNIKYNPLTKAQFAPVYNFLMHRKGSLLPFFVSLPQYKLPKDPLFAAFINSTSFSDITVAGNGETGYHTLVLTNSAWTGNDFSTIGLPKFGDLFNVLDSTDSLHTKTYMISRVETYNTYETDPGSGNIRIHFSPGLQRKTYTNAVVNFNSPIIKVINSTDIQEYSLGSDNLYQFSIKLEEALY
jgi:hypothetical protein